MIANLYSRFIKTPQKDIHNSLARLPLHYLYLLMVFNLVIAWLSEGYSHADEHFQIFEFAAYKIHHYTYSYPWELTEQIRPSLQVWMLIWAIKFFSYLSPTISPFMIAFIARAMSGMLSALACYLFINAFQFELHTHNKRKWFFLLSAFSYIAVYQGVRFSSESMSGHLFLIGFSMIFLRELKVDFYSLLIGLLLGSSFFIRFQSAFLIFGLIAWLCVFRKIKFPALLTIGFGMLILFLYGSYLDYLFYENWVSTIWNYFNANIVKSVASVFGVSRWEYITIVTFLPYGPAYLLGTIYFILKRPAHVLSWVMLPFIAVHAMIPHKELRFLIPIISFMPFVMLYSLQMLQEKYQFSGKCQRTFLAVNQIAWWLNVGMLVLVLACGMNLFGVYQYLWKYQPNQSITLNKFSQDAIVSIDNSINSNMPLRFYLPDRIYVRQFNQSDAYICHKNSLCLLWLPCSKEKRTDLNLIYDSCPSDSLYSTFNFNHWKDRSAFYREKARLYAIEKLTSS